MSAVSTGIFIHKVKSHFTWTSIDMEMMNLISNPPKVEKFCPVLPWRQKNATSEQKVWEKLTEDF